MSKSDYCGYIIFHDRNGAQGWKGEYDPTRPADVVSTATDGKAFPDAMHIIDVLEGYEAAHKGVAVPV